ncbi:MAG: amino acid ABC transporter substrate-binding protein [Rhizobiales bacterium 35-68-8]|nr:MAG: amino acid ABC transporter substrate-binding protein [Rhizobiales bacterium 35-68-8]
MSGLSRRALLAGALLAGAALPARAAAPRVAALDWALLETLLAMGIVPVAAAELVLFRAVAVEPPVPASVADIGLRGLPSFEALRLAAPDLIFSSAFYALSEPQLRMIAPVETITIYQRGSAPLKRAQDAALRLADACGRPMAGPALVARTDAVLEDCRRAVAAHANRPLLVINLGDARHFRVFGRDSIFGEVLARLGLTNAWTQNTSYAASAPVGLEALAGFPDAGLVILPPIPPDARRVLPDSALWNALPGVQGRQVRVLSSVNPFGGLPTAERFARLLAESLARPEGNGLG